MYQFKKIKINENNLFKCKSPVIKIVNPLENRKKIKFRKIEPVKKSTINSQKIISNSSRNINIPLKKCVSMYVMNRMNLKRRIFSGNIENRTSSLDEFSKMILRSDKSYQNERFLHSCFDFGKLMEENKYRNLKDKKFIRSFTSKYGRYHDHDYLDNNDNNQNIHINPHIIKLIRLSKIKSGKNPSNNFFMPNIY